MPSNATALRRILVRIGRPCRQPGLLHQTNPRSPNDHHCKWQHTATDRHTTGEGRTSNPPQQQYPTYGGEVRKDEHGGRTTPAFPFDAQHGQELQREPAHGSQGSCHGGSNVHRARKDADEQSNDLETRNAPNRQQQRALAEDEGSAPDPPTTSKPPNITTVKRPNRRSQLQGPKAFPAVLKSAGDREGDSGWVRRLKARQDLKPKYFEAYARKELSRKQKSAFQVEKLWDRQGPRSRDVQAVLKMLEDNTPVGSEHYSKRSETVRLPEGVRATFVGNSGERVLEIMQRTGSHVQLSGDQTEGYSTAIGSATEFGFNALTLLGTPQENEAALSLLPSFVQVVVDDNLNASKNLADYKLRSADGLPRHLLGHTDDPADAPWIEEHSEADLQLQRAIDSVTPPVRAVWDRSSQASAFEPKYVASPALAVTEQMRRLTAPQPRLQSRKRLVAPEPDSTDVPQLGAASELLGLIRKTTDLPSEALTLAIDFLTYHNLLPQLRRALDFAARTSPKALTPANYNRILASCAQSQSIVDYGHTLGVMLQQKQVPTAETWTHFHTLVALRFPASAPHIKDKMREKGILSDPKVQIATLQNTIERRLTTFLDTTSANVTGTDNDITAFITRLDLQHPRLHWLTLSTANRLLKILLARGHRVQAFTLLSLFPSRCLKPKTDTLNTFLTSAYRDDDLASFITILQHFDTHQTEPIPFDEVTWYLLFKLAWSRRSWNVCRVSWRYAVMAGLVKFEMQELVQKSLMCPLPEAANGAEAKGGFQARGELFNSLAGKFVVGVSGGLKRGDSGSEPEEGEDGELLERESRTLELAAASRKRRKYLKELLKLDLAEVESLRPKYPILEKLKEAFEKDLRWKERGLGLPGGLRKGGRYEKMVAREGGILGEVLLHGIRVPVVVGDGTKGVRVGGEMVWTGNLVGGEEPGARYARVAAWQAGSWDELGLGGGERSEEGRGDGREIV